MPEDIQTALARRKTAQEKALRAKLGKALVLTDAELDEMAAITSRDQQLASAHALKYGSARFNALLDATDTIDPLALDPNITS